MNTIDHLIYSIASSKTLLLIVVGIVILAIPVSYIIGAMSRQMNKSREDNEDYLEFLEHQIKLKADELDTLRTQQRNQSIDRHTNLTNLESSVLDRYEQTGIRLSSDILEELVHQKLETESDIIHFVENQRKFWKLENTKPPYIKK